MMWDAVVAGAGPAGCIAALVLARGGCKVVLADTVDTGRHKVGEALPAAAARLLRALDVPTPGHAHGHIRIGGNLSCWGSDDLIARDCFRDPEGSGWRLDRHRFDAELRKTVMDARAVFKGSRVLRIQRVRSYWKIQFTDGTEAATRWLIDASGRQSSLAQQLGAVRRQDAPLVALYCLGRTEQTAILNRTVVEATPEGWWYAAYLPSGMLLGGFHLHPSAARRIVKDTEVWSELWAETQHLSRLFAHATFTERLRPLNASGARLDRFHGDGWIACGDAALSFDPLSSQGMLTALYGGMHTGQNVLGALGGRGLLSAEYSEKLESIRAIYQLNLRTAYRQEQRWAAEDFWRLNHEAAI